MGHAYLWGLSEQERDFLLQAIRKRNGGEWPALKRQLAAAFKALDGKGFCIAEGTYERAINGVGVALALPGGAGVYAMSCSAPAFHFPLKRLHEEIGPRLVALAHSVQEDVQRQTRAF